MADKSPKNVTIYGRLSYPTFTMAQAIERNKKSDFPKKDSDITPDFNLLVEQAQLDKLLTHVRDVFLPYCLGQSKAGEKRDALDAKQIKRITDLLDSGEWENQPPYIPVKVISEKTAPLAPECVASIKIVGTKGVDVDLKAVVQSEDELVIPDPDILNYPVIKPLHHTVHQMNPGSYVAATLNLYAFISGKLPGFSASSGTAVFKMEGERIGGGAAIDEDEIFAD